MRKLSDPAGDQPDWARIARLSREILAVECKDLQVAAYWAYAQYESGAHPIEELAWGVEVLAALMERYEQALFPARARARVGALAWLLERLEGSLAVAGVDGPDLFGLRRLERAIKALRAVTYAQLQDQAPAFRPIQRLVDRLLERATSLDTLLQRVYEAPDSDAPRAVYADWLMERSDPRGEFINLQLQQAQGSLSEAGAQQMAKLLTEHGKRWLSGLSPMIDRLEDVRFERGFVTAARLRGLDQHGPRLSELSSYPLLEALDIRASKGFSWLLELPALRALGSVPIEAVEQLKTHPGISLLGLQTIPSAVRPLIKQLRALPALSHLRLGGHNDYTGRQRQRWASELALKPLKPLWTQLRLEQLGLPLAALEPLGGWLNELQKNAKGLRTLEWHDSALGESWGLGLRARLGRSQGAFSSIEVLLHPQRGISRSLFQLLNALEAVHFEQIRGALVPGPAQSFQSLQALRDWLGEQERHRKDLVF